MRRISCRHDNAPGAQKKAPGSTDPVVFDRRPAERDTPRLTSAAAGGNRDRGPQRLRHRRKKAATPWRRAMHTYLIHPLVLGSKIFDKGMMTYQHGYGTPYTIPIYAWYLEGGDRRILVDTGELAPIRSADREAAIGGPIRSFEAGLARWGLAPETIDLVIHTHLHNDHCENDAKCVNAEIVVHEKELERIHAPHPLDYRYLADWIEEVEARGQIRTVAGDAELAPGLRVIHTPAHTEGGLTVLVDTPQGMAAITGFCTIMENFFPPREIRAMEMEVIPPGTPVNPAAAYDILCRVKALTPRLVPLHEPRFAAMETLRFNE
jgi:glyoxylase-like metal-dependent hydrolase (beta-lactamase superfamily II)